MDRENVQFEQLLALSEQLQYTEPVRHKTLIVHCDINHIDRVSTALQQLYATGDMPGIITAFHVYGHPRAEDAQESTVQLATLDHSFAKRLHGLASGLDKAMSAFGVAAHVCSLNIKAYTAKLLEEQEELARAKNNAFCFDKFCFEEFGLMPKIDFDAAFDLEPITRCGTISAAKRKGGKKKRGHNHDRDRVVGGKGGYC